MIVRFSGGSLMRHLFRSLCLIVLALWFTLPAVTPGHAGSNGYTILYSFAGGPDGSYPAGEIAEDRKGNLFGTTNSGGAGCRKHGTNHDCGIIFELSAETEKPKRDKESIVYEFQKHADNPLAGVIINKSGSLFGSVSYGGINNCYRGCGAVYKRGSTGRFSILYAFKGGSDGAYPESELFMDASGNIFGTTSAGGDTGCSIDVEPGCGIVYELSPAGIETVLHKFSGVANGDGAVSNSGLIGDASGNLYGTTIWGGSSTCASAGCGTVFRISPDDTETVLYAFGGGVDGGGPQAALTRDASGNLYGTTSGGGDPNCHCGTVFKLSASGEETVLHSFLGGDDGAFPWAGVTMDSAGNLYGTTTSGGGIVCATESTGCGIVFSISASGKESILHAFAGQSDGQYPTGQLLLDKSGRLVGTTDLGGGDSCSLGYGCGTVFALNK
ncbi:MAG TPA: choice-of-anchor tandem repeat GloVer-containing protein [Rhizomicrobium sp.]|jgi:uncharacterized repeat protein (TIGR03803 family)